MRPSTHPSPAFKAHPTVLLSPLTIHPDVSGRPHIILIIEECAGSPMATLRSELTTSHRLIEYINGHEGVEWVTMKVRATPGAGLLDADGVSERRRSTTSSARETRRPTARPCRRACNGRAHVYRIVQGPSARFPLPYCCMRAHSRSWFERADQKVGRQSLSAALRLLVYVITLQL